jgi:hypothetical protein
MALNAPDSSQFLLAEYKELRGEILKRSEIQHQLISFSLAALGALMAVGLKDSPNALLAYPIVTLGLAIGWTYNDLQIAQLGLYIKHRIESRLAALGIGWQHYITSEAASKRIGSLAKLSTRGVFWISEILTIVLYVGKRQAPWPTTLTGVAPDDYLLAVSIAAIVLTMWVMRNQDQLVREMESSIQRDGDRPSPAA